MKTTEGYAQIPGSFRDPSGFVFVEQGVTYRQINRAYREPYEHLMQSGLYENLASDGLLIPHRELGLQHAATEDAFKIIEPAQIPFISHPYEWCFSQLKDAALLTLEIQRRALDHGMSLKDCSAYNVQFCNGKPLFIDTLSFEQYREGQPWVAYRQFCQHFLAPLALMSRADIRLHQLLRVYLDGIPLDLASLLLPAHTWVNLALLSHIHLHARAQGRFSDKSIQAERRIMGRTAFLGLVDSLRAVIEKLGWRPSGTEWHDYYAVSSYGSESMEHKKRLVAGMLDRLAPAPKSVWDLGANVGVFSRIASGRGLLTVSFDKDPAVVEENYLESTANAESHILPLVLDLTNPSPGLGWENQERTSLLERGPADCVLALALVHHLAISNNLPFGKLASFLGQVSNSLIIEYVPKGDPQVQRLLASREDIFEQYDQRAFEREFSEFFTVQDKKRITETDRTLYLMAKRGSAYE